MKNELKFKLRKDVITGFSFSFTSSLVCKLKELIEADRVFEYGNEKSKGEGFANKTTEIAAVVISYLGDQLHCRISGNVPCINFMRS